MAKSSEGDCDPFSTYFSLLMAELFVHVASLAFPIHSNFLSAESRQRDTTRKTAGSIRESCHVFALIV
jgi:hypothetical protein